MRRTARVWSFLLVLVTLAGCAMTQVRSVWWDRSYDGPPFQRVLVAAVGREEGVRRRLEDDLVRALLERGVDAAPSYRFVDTPEPHLEDLEGAIEAFGADGVLLTGTIQTSERVAASYAPSFGYGWGWYGGAWGVGYAPYYDVDVIVQVPIELYEADGLRLVWSGRSTSVDPSSTVSLFDDVSKETVNRLAKVRIIAAEPESSG